MKKCLNCGKEIPPKNKYCNNSCQQEFQYKEEINKWKNGDKSGTRGATQVSRYVKRYLFEKFDNKCSICGWGEISPFTNTTPLEIHHIDGDCTNCSENNLTLLCPNCHSLTDNFGILNKNSKRFHRDKMTL